MKHKRKSVRIIYLLFLLCIILIIIELYHSKYGLEVSRYKITKNNGNDQTSLRILQITDLHDSIFGKNNDTLVFSVEQEQPDLIFITGDLINCYKQADTLQASKFVARLVDIAPVYISLGNQEMSLIKDKGIDVIHNYQDVGATVLEYSYVDVEIKGEEYRIGGVYGYCQPFLYAIESHWENENNFLIDFQNTDRYKLLLCHMPVCWSDSYSLYDWDVDVVFSGHAHGGQIRIPFIGGLWAPDQGWFPGRLSGVYKTSLDGWKQSREKILEYARYMKYDPSYYEKHDKYYPSSLVLSRGLGNTDWVPRFNNPPEIVVVDLVPGED